MQIDESPKGKNPERYLTIKVRRRPWYVWLLWLVWLVLMGLFIEFALASGAEGETQAARLSWVIFFFLLIGGLAVNYVRSKEADQLDDE